MSKISFPVKLELLQYTKEELDKLKDTFIGKLILDMTQQQQFDLYKAIEYHLYKYPDIGNTNLDEYSINFIQNEIIRFHKWYTFLFRLNNPLNDAIKYKNKDR